MWFLRFLWAHCCPIGRARLWVEGHNKVLFDCYSLRRLDFVLRPKVLGTHMHAVCLSLPLTLAPKWTSFSDGTLQLVRCVACAREMP